MSIAPPPPPCGAGLRRPRSASQDRASPRRMPFPTCPTSPQEYDHPERRGIPAPINASPPSKRLPGHNGVHGSPQPPCLQGTHRAGEAALVGPGPGSPKCTAPSDGVAAPRAPRQVCPLPVDGAPACVRCAGVSCPGIAAAVLWRVVVRETPLANADVPGLVQAVVRAAGPSVWQG